MVEKDYRLSTTAGEEIKKIEIAGVKKDALRTRMDGDFALFTLVEDKYLIPKKEGEWEEAIINTASTDGNRMIELLAYADEHLKIAITDEKKKSRSDLHFTEHAAIGLLTLADMINEEIPESATVRGAAAAFAVIRGWTAYREMIVEEDDDITPDLVAWDPRNVYWISGKRRLIWVCYVRYALDSEIEDEYPGWNDKKLTSGTRVSGNTAYTPIYDIWKCADPKKPAQNGVAINKEWIKEPEDVKVGGKPLFYIPVRIKAMRTLPLMMDGISSDTIKHVGESFLVNNRKLLPIENHAFQYKMQAAANLAKSPIIIGFDSTKGELPPGEIFAKNPFTKGRVIPLDKGKGQELLARLTPAQGTEIDSALGLIMGMRSTGSGLGPVAYGQPPYPETAQATDIINHNILDAIKPYKLGLEADRVWQAQEFIRQYKMGNFKEREFEGYDEHGKRFKTKVTPKKIDDNWRFECKLVLDLVRDKNLNIGMAATAIKAGVLSAQTARDEFDICKDPDGEQSIIDREKASEIGELALLKTAKELWDEKDSFSRLQAQQIFIKLMQAGMGQKPPQPGGMPGGGMPGVMSPEATAGAARTSRVAQPVIPAPVREAARKRGNIK